MKRIPIDEDLRRKLLDLDNDLELCDEKGNVLARVVRSTPWTNREDWVPSAPEISPEEIQRRLNANERTYTTEQVIEKLRRL